MRLPLFGAAGSLRQLFSPFCLPFSLYDPNPAPKFPVVNMLKTPVCLEAVALQPIHGPRKPLAEISSSIAVSRGLPEVRELENINRAFDSNLAFSTGDIIEPNI